MARQGAGSGRRGRRTGERMSRRDMSAGKGLALTRRGRGWRRRLRGMAHGRPLSPAPAACRCVGPRCRLAGRTAARGAVTNLPLPRYVSLKTGEGNARRGPGSTHRIDWVFTRAGHAAAHHRRIRATGGGSRTVKGGAAGCISPAVGRAHGAGARRTWPTFRSLPDSRGAGAGQGRDRGGRRGLLRMPCRTGAGSAADGAHGWVAEDRPLGRRRRTNCVD